MPQRCRFTAAVEVCLVPGNRCRVRRPPSAGPRACSGVRALDPSMPSEDVLAARSDALFRAQVAGAWPRTPP